MRNVVGSDGAKQTANVTAVTLEGITALTAKSAPNANPLSTRLLPYSAATAMALL